MNEMKTEQSKNGRPHEENFSGVVSEDISSDHYVANNGINRLQENIKKNCEQMIKNYIFLNSLNKGLPLKNFINNLEKNLIDLALSMTKGNQKDVCMILGIKESTLCEKIKRYKIQKQRHCIDYLQYVDTDFLA
jgi:DNA-binding NtrC family response regulator